MGLPIGHALGRIAAQSEDIFNTVFFEPSEHGASIIFRLADDG